jgi:hypothetical protein
MDRVVQTTFRNTVEFLRSEVELMPLSRWNESVFRYCFCRSLCMVYPQIEQLVECGRIDLVLRQQPLAAFIEFKFYQHSRQFDPYDGRPRGYKGGPSLKNVREFQMCIHQLHERPSVAGLFKYIVLVYADPKDDSRPNCGFSRYYNDYHHPRDGASLRRIECSTPIETTEAIIRAQLYEVDGATKGVQDIGNNH